MAKRGICEFCGNEKSLNAKGLCGACKDVTPCAVHEDILTAQKCSICRKSACAYCILQGRCETCRESDASDIKSRRGESPEVKAKARRKKMIRAAVIGVVGLLILGGAGIAGVSMFMTPPPPISPQDSLEAASKGIAGFQKKNHKLPTRVTEMQAAIRDAGGPVPLLVPKTARPIPNAVTFETVDGTLTLQAYTDGGSIWREHGVPAVRRFAKAP